MSSDLNQINIALVVDRRKFFDAKERPQKTKNLVAPDDVAAADLDRKMLAVVARAEQPELFNRLASIESSGTP
jgi:hypothetical protein